MPSCVLKHTAVVNPGMYVVVVIFLVSSKFNDFAKLQPDSSLVSVMVQPGM